MKVLLTSTSFQDTPGKHQDLLKAQGYELDMLRGPLLEDELLPIVGNYDAIICGDDEYTEKVLEKGFEGRLRYISKYGVGLDRIDLNAAEKLGIPVTNCPGVNQISVSEHVLALLFTFEKNIHVQHNSTQNGSWKRWVGQEIHGRTIGIVGLGAVGRELAKKSNALGMKVLAFDIFKDKDFLKAHDYVSFVSNLDEIYSQAEIISLHLPHTSESKHMINEEVVFEKLKRNPILINTSRGKLVDSKVIIKALKAERIRGYLTDVLAHEPMLADEVLKGVENIIITPHVGSRTFQSVERQGIMAVTNLLKLAGKDL
ncbi:phosphoglycerate dehydrogenase [Costertonia aggregata]|uniref:Phosphoglycerate dehydrogenase n=1 Tax=Costertonia aggregata TaxID=343403 RepID=A0A7H9APA9_9FLAO|nr:phosphoglycerate dehydrogenase [Costertonia aggregata]QLG45244.1 phosphoglycerate dehydrogenase [Costertonia aggregata]